MSHRANDILAEQLLEWMEEQRFDEILNLQELTLEQMVEIQKCFIGFEDPDDVEYALKKCLDNIDNPKIWK